MKKILSYISAVAVATAIMSTFIATAGAAAKTETVSLTGLDTATYSSNEDYVDLNDWVKIQSTVNSDNKLGVHESGIVVQKNSGVTIKVTPKEDGQLAVIYGKYNDDEGKVALTQTGESGKNTLISGTAVAVKEQKEYIIQGDSSSAKALVTAITFTPDNYADFVTSDTENAGAETGDDGSEATAFITTVTNAGTKEGTLSKLTWNITSDGQNGSYEAAPNMNITLGENGAVTFGLIVTGLNDSTATVSVTAE